MKQRIFASCIPKHPTASMSDPNPSLMLWEKRKRVKPSLLQYDVEKKKTKVIVQTRRKTKKKSEQKRNLKVYENDDDENESNNEDNTISKRQKKGKETTKQVIKITDEVKKLLNTSFYEENGEEWNGTTIHFDDLLTIRKLWQLPAACHILWLLQQPLKLKVYNTLREYEAALLNPQTSAVLEDVFTKLLLGKKEREKLHSGLGLSYEWWNKRLEEYLDEKYKKLERLRQKAGQTGSDDDEDESNDLREEESAALNSLASGLQVLGKENPLKNEEFKDLDPIKRCQVLLYLCETVLEHPSNMDYIREMQDDDIRLQPIGTDRMGNQFYFYPQFYQERRVYRLTPGESKSGSWDLWAKGLNSIQEMRDTFGQVVKKGRKCEGEHALVDHLDAMLELLRQEKIEEQKNEDKALKRAILEAMPRKRSARIQVKTLEQMEIEKLQMEKEAAEEAIRVEQKRLEVLASMEREKELERKRMLESREQRLAMKIDRETRRQKRFELEEAQWNEEQSLAQQAQRDEHALQRQQSPPPTEIPVGGGNSTD